MSSVFLSYRRSDSADVTGRIYEHLASRFGRENIFKDVDSIPLGKDFRRSITEAVRSCDVLLAVIGESWLQVSDEAGNRRLDDPDDYVRIELETALASDIPVIPVLVRGANIPASEALPPGLAELVYRNAAQVRPDPDFSTDVARLCRSLETELRVVKEIGPSPYKGLAAFEEQDAELFFGREEQTERLWQLFRDLHESSTAGRAAPRLLPILGPSGCGKSSLAKAGLIAALKRRPLPGWKGVRFASLAPGYHPLESLAAELARNATGDAISIEKADEFTRVMARPGESQAYDGLRRIADFLPDISTTPLVILIDQFEEIYALCENKDERQAFIENLLCAAREPGGRVFVVITLRSDFLGETQSHQTLNQWIAERGVIIPAMNEEELHRAIAEPALRAGHALDPAVVDLMLRETQDREGALPMLQFALDRVWHGLREGTEPADTLKEIGGVGGALAQEAQRIYDRLSADEKRIARRIFLALVQLGEGTRDTRRRTPIESLVTPKDDYHQVHRVMSRFAARGARLITLFSAPDGSQMAEITHEALFDHWQALSDWLDECREDLRFHHRLDEAARHWDTMGRPEGLLWRSPDLDLLRQFHERAGEDMNRTQLDFLGAADERQKCEERLNRRRARFYQAAAILFFALTCVIGLLGLKAYKLALAERSAREEADRGTRTSNIHRLVAQSQQAFLEAFPIRSLLLAEQAVRVSLNNNERHLPAAEQALRDSLARVGGRGLSGHTGPIADVAFIPDGRWLATGSSDTTARLWDLRIDELLQQVRLVTGRELTAEERRQYLLEPEGSTP